MRPAHENMRMGFMSFVRLSRSQSMYVLSVLRIENNRNGYDVKVTVHGCCCERMFTVHWRALREPKASPASYYMGV